MARRFVCGRVFVLLACVAAMMLGMQDNAIAETITVADGPDNDTLRIQAAIDRAYGQAGPDTVELGDVPSGGCFELKSTGGTSSGTDKAKALVLRSYAGNELTFDGRGQPICRLQSPQRAGLNPDNPTFTWFWAQNTVNTTVTGLDVRGGAQEEDLHPEDREYYLDFLTDLKGSTDFTFTNSRAQNMYGLCLIGENITSALVQGVECANPGRAGFNFQGASTGNLIVSSSATSTGDDSIAFNSTNAGRNMDNTVQGGVYYQDRRTAQGGALAIRGAANIRATKNAAGNGPRFGSDYPAGTAVLNGQTVFITDAPSNQGANTTSFNANGVDVHYARVIYRGSSRGAFYVTSGSRDVVLTNNRIEYNGCPTYGVLREANTDVLGLANNTYVPDGRCNY